LALYRRREISPRGRRASFAVTALEGFAFKVRNGCEADQRRDLFAARGTKSFPFPLAACRKPCKPDRELTIVREVRTGCSSCEWV